MPCQAMRPVRTYRIKGQSPCRVQIGAPLTYTLSDYPFNDSHSYIQPRRPSVPKFSMSHVSSRFSTNARALNHMLKVFVAQAFVAIPVPVPCQWGLQQIRRSTNTQLMTFHPMLILSKECSPARLFVLF